MGAPESLSPGLTARPMPGHVSPPERESIPAGPGEREAEAATLSLRSAACQNPRIPRHPPPAAGVPLDFLTGREQCPAGSLRAHCALRPVREVPTSSEPSITPYPRLSRHKAPAALGPERASQDPRE